LSVSPAAGRWSGLLVENLRLGVGMLLLLAAAYRGRAEHPQGPEALPAPKHSGVGRRTQ